MVEERHTAVVYLVCNRSRIAYCYREGENDAINLHLIVGEMRLQFMKSARGNL